MSKRIHGRGADAAPALWRDEAGVSLLQAMVFMAILIILGASYAQYQSQTRKAQRQRDTKTEYEQISDTVRGTAAQASALQSTCELTD